MSEVELKEQYDEAGHYLTQRELFDKIIESRIKGKISDELGEMFYLITTKYSNHRNFVRYYHIKNDLIAAGVEACCKAYAKYRPYKDKNIEWDGETPLVFDHNIHNNSFAYFTTAIHHNFIGVLKAEYKQSNIMNEMRLENGLDASFGYEDMITEREEREKDLIEEERNTTKPKTLDFRNRGLWEDEEAAAEEPESAQDEQIEWGE